MLLQLVTVTATIIAKMILKLLHQGIDLSPCRTSLALQDESIQDHTENNAGEKPNHQPVGEHLIGHISTPHRNARGSALIIVKSPHHQY